MDSVTLKFKEAVEYVVKNKKAKSKGEIAEKLNYNTQGAFSDVLNGRAKLPAIVLQKFCEIYNINADWVLFDRGNIDLDKVDEKPTISKVDLENIINQILNQVSKKFNFVT